MTKYSHMGIDFTIDESRYGVFTSYKSDGTAMTSAGTQEGCLEATKTIRIPVLLGVFDGYEAIIGNATVDGKL